MEILRAGLIATRRAMSRVILFQRAIFIFAAAVVALMLPYIFIFAAFGAFGALMLLCGIQAVSLQTFSVLVYCDGSIYREVSCVMCMQEWMRW